MREKARRFTRFHGGLHIATLLIGAGFLGISTHLPAGSTLFYVLTALLGVTWFFGAWITHEERGIWGWLRECDARHRAPFLPSALSGFIVGATLAAIFIAGAFVVDYLPIVRDPVVDLLGHARFGALPMVTIITATTGCAEEIYFRGALFRDLPRKHAVWVSACLYALVTAVSGIVLLTVAAFALGFVCALARNRWGRVDQCVIIHLTWSMSMLYILPLIIT
ncbi:MAG: CPBP family intramembrane metalloprotease [Actinomycetaceae bacterium]|nr:CPBP family intramembrane metalloprotease [Actinomycetaceae bacterium]